MTVATESPQAPSMLPQFDELLDLLGFREDDPITVCSRLKGFPFTSERTKRYLAGSTAFGHRRLADVWFSANPIYPRRETGRGTKEDVTRCVALRADLDTKDTGAHDLDTISAIIKEVGEALGQPAVAVVDSGNGAHPYWVLDGDDPTWTLDTQEKRADAQAVYRRFHRLVGKIATEHGAGVDNVSDLCRVLRVPGTFNHKTDPPKPVELIALPFGEPRRLTFAEVTARLDELRIQKYDEDRMVFGEAVSHNENWKFALVTHLYVAKMIAGWRADIPQDGRHNWMVSCMVRLACAHRTGRISQGDYTTALGVLEGRFTADDFRDPEPVTEVSDALEWAIGRAETLSDDDALAQVGGPDKAAVGADQSGGERSLTLPESFWSSRPILNHIWRKATHHKSAPDAVLNAVLAHMSARMPHKVLIDTGSLWAMPLHHYAGIIGFPGRIKSAAIETAHRGTEYTYSAHGGLTTGVPNALTGGADLVTVSDPTGQGLLAAYMETTSIPPPENAPKGTKPRTELIQVRHNALLEKREGHSLIQAFTEKGAKLPDMLRSMWSGERAAQDNATRELRRVLDPGTYAFAMCVVIQSEIFADFNTKEQLAMGTPQRFLLSLATIEKRPEGRVDDPGPIPVTLPPQGTTVTVCDEVERLIAHEIDRRTWNDPDDHIRTEEAHMPGVTARVAGLLALLDHRAEVTIDDWLLAKTMFDTSLAISDSLMAQHRKAKAYAKRADRLEASMARVEANEAMESPEARIRLAIIKAVSERGGVAKWTGADGVRQGLKSNDRPNADRVIERMVADGEVTLRPSGKSTFVELVAA